MKISWDILHTCLTIKIRKKRKDDEEDFVFYSCYADDDVHYC